MGNSNGGGKGSYRTEVVTKAEYVQRTLGPSSSGSGSGSSGANHHGVVCHTSAGNSYLIHHPGPQGVTTVTPASNMSKNWKVDHSIPVNGNKTIQQVFNGAGGRSNNGYVNYVSAGTCIGAAKGAESTLKK